MENENTAIIHPNVKDSRVLTYLNLRNQPEYVNTAEETELLQLWRTKYYIARSEFEQSRANPENLQRWRDGFVGKFYKLNDDGTFSKERLKGIRKVGFELVENKVNSNIPAPKMSPRYHADLTPINATENLIRHEMDKMLSEEVNDESEHNVLIDGTSWFYVGWNPFDNTHERSGNPIVRACAVDTVIPQPGVKNYKLMEYIFEIGSLTVAQCLDLYNREIKSPTNNDVIPTITAYFLNEDRYVGKFMWCEETNQVICNDLEWGIRKRRECVSCGLVCPIEDTCPICGSKKFKYAPVKEERLKEDLVYVTNPYRSGDSPDANDDGNTIDETQGLPAGTIVPHYLIRQLPFVPYKRITVPGSIYGMSQIETIYEDQDLINKFLNKAERKSARSKTWVTKLKDTNIAQDCDEISLVEVESPQEGQSIQVKQVTSDITEEISQAQMLYEIAKSTTGITDTDQGKADTTARSGKAKQLQMQASAQRNQAPDTLRNLAYSGVYELIFKNLLAYCDENRSYVSLLPDGSEMEQVWSKYMFLDRDENGELYYRDDYAFSVDTATEITQDRASMWQLIDNDYINGTMGNQIDPNRALLMYWQMKDQCGYPLAKYALAFLKSAQKQLPSDVEKVLAENPEAVQLALSFIQDQQQMAGLAKGGNGQLNGLKQAAQRGQSQLGSEETRGGAREGAGREGNGGTHQANVEKTNNKNRAQSGASATNTNAVSTGGMQGGTKVSSTQTGQQ